MVLGLRFHALPEREGGRAHPGADGVREKREIVLNVSLNATRNLTINNELIQFSARSTGVARGQHPGGPGPGHFRPGNGQGAFFTVESPAALAVAPSGPVASGEAEVEPPRPPAAGKSRLKLVK
jgi:stringent starvation protein B